VVAAAYSGRSRRGASRSRRPGRRLRDIASGRLPVAHYRDRRCGRGCRGTRHHVFERSHRSPTRSPQSCRLQRDPGRRLERLKRCSGARDDIDAVLPDLIIHRDRGSRSWCSSSRLGIARSGLRIGRARTVRSAQHDQGRAKRLRLDRHPRRLHHLRASQSPRGRTRACMASQRRCRGTRYHEQRKPRKRRGATRHYGAPESPSLVWR